MLAGVSPRDWVYGSVSHTEACLLYNTCLCTCMAVVVMAGGESLCLKILQTSECVCCFWITFLNLHFKWYEYYVFHMFLPFFFKIDDKVSHIRNCNSTLDTNFGLDFYLQFSSVQFSRSVVSNSLRPHELQHARPPCPSPTPGVYSNSCPSSWWCHPAISSSVVPFSSCPQSLPASQSFPMSQLFTWGGQSTGVSALASFLPKNTQGWSPLGWTGWISLQSKGLSRVFSNTTVQKHQFFGAQLSFFGAQLSSPSNFHIHTWLQEKP